MPVENLKKKDNSYLQLRFPQITLPVTSYHIMALKGYSEVTLPLNAHTVDFRSAGERGSMQEAEQQETRNFAVLTGRLPRGFF
jgi:hypothetical protein